MKHTPAFEARHLIADATPAPATVTDYTRPASPSYGLTSQLALFDEHAVAQGFTESRTAIVSDHSIVKITYSSTDPLIGNEVTVYFATDSGEVLAAQDRTVTTPSTSESNVEHDALGLLTRAPEADKIVDPDPSTESWSAADLARATALLDIVEGYEHKANTNAALSYSARSLCLTVATELRAFGVDHGILDPSDGPSDADRESL